MRTFDSPCDGNRLSRWRRAKENWNTQSDKIELAGNSPLTDEGIAYCAEEGSPSRLPDDTGNAAKIGFPSEQAHDEACMGDEMAAANGSVHDDAGL